MKKKNTETIEELEYLNNKPRRIFWKHVVGPDLTEIQESDLVYDAYDFKIRQLEWRPRNVY
jgi:hypothetical protein